MTTSAHTQVICDLVLTERPKKRSPAISTPATASLEAGAHVDPRKGGTRKSNASQNVRYIQELLSYALEAMAKFPHGYAPDASGFSELSPKDELTGLKEILGRTDAQRRINEIAASSPEELHSAFLHCGELLGRCLQPYGVLEPIGMIDAMNIVLRDPELMQLAGAMTDPIFLPSQHQSGQPRAFCLT